jgi:quercetin dioxygenase-like cupin family protein
MKRPSFFAAVFIAAVSVLLCSGQLTRPVAQRPPAQTQQRPSVPRQAAPPKPAPPPANPASPTIEMPLLFWLPEDIKFPEGTSPRNITLFGDPKNEGLYVTRTLIPKGVQTIPHKHPDSRMVTVISGVCYYGHGDEFDERRLIPMPPGSFFTEPAGVPHFIWAKDDDVIVQTTAIGPSGTQLVPDRKPGGVQGRP